MIPLEITVRKTNGCYKLYVRSPITGESPAGTRLFRAVAQECPEIQWEYDSYDVAIRQAEILQKHLDDAEKRRKKHGGRKRAATGSTGDDLLLD
jgi:hypothetical protein